MGLETKYWVMWLLHAHQKTYNKNTRGISCKKMKKYHRFLEKQKISSNAIRDNKQARLEWNFIKE